MWWTGRAGTSATPLARGVACLVARRRFNSQLDGDESAKGFWVASYTSAGQAAGPGSGGHPHSVSEAPGISRPGFCGTGWDWRLLILIATPANHGWGGHPPRIGRGGCAGPLDRNQHERPGPVQARRSTALFEIARDGASCL
jgi:hypothetical protein